MIPGLLARADCTVLSRNFRPLIPKVLSSCGLVIRHDSFIRCAEFRVSSANPRQVHISYESQLETETVTDEVEH